MMKRVIALLCAVVLAAAVLTACGNNNKQIPNANELLSSLAEALGSKVENSASQVESALDNTANSVESAASEISSAASDVQTTNPGDIAGKGTVSDGLKVEGIPFFDDYSKNVYLLITNDSDKDCNMSISMDFFKDGKIVGTTSSSIDAVAKGTTVCEDFSCDEDFNSYEYKVVASDLSSYDVPVDQDLALEVSQLTNKVIVSLTNNGKIPAKYVWYDVFFYKNGKLVDHNYRYCEDDDSEIKPGATVRSECSAYVEGGFDDAKVYFHGEGYKE